MKKLLPVCLYLFLFTLMVSCIADREDIGDNQVPDKQAARRGLGQSANEILSAQQFVKLQVEIAFMSGFQPSSNVVNNIGNFLTELVHKPEGIEVILREIPAMEQNTYTAQEIRQIEEEHRETYNIANTLSIFVLILDGYFSNDDEENFALGAAYQNTSLVLFGKRIEENSGGIRRPSKAVLESTVAMHEMGHLLGLVNVGTDMVNNHEDEENHAHCDNENCLMFWAVETNSIFRYMVNSIPTLDQNCRNDLKANGGR